MEDVTGNNPRMDWLNILRYHREVIEKGSSNFFSIPVEGVDRYTQLMNFSPASYEAPWSITADEMIMEFLEEQINNNEKPQLILGCLCWRSYNKDKHYLNPLLYIDVSIEQVIEDSIIIKPDAFHWTFSPLIESALRSKQIGFQDNLHEKLPELLKKAEEDNTPATKDITTAFKDALLKEFPVFKEILGKDVLGWILFTPPKSYEYTKHILNDYKEIEALIEENPEDIGGLQLLEGRPDQIIQDAGGILPVVPLNPEQKHAVSHILSANPITVISGPPGCGKSQVVVSLLINCWAEGKTALFASYVNEAVNVIHERIKTIEEEAKRETLPVTIKAGKNNTIVSGIGKVRNSIILHQPVKPEAIHELVTRKEELERKKEGFKKYIDTGIPQQIDESMHSAFDAYALAMRHHEELNKQYKEYQSRLQSIGYPIKPEEFKEVISGIERWLKERYDYLLEIKEKTKIKKEYQDKADTLAEDITSILESFNLPNKPRQWYLLLEDSDTPEKLLEWYGRYKSMLFQEDMHKAVCSSGVKSEHRVWSGIEDVEKWLGDAQRLSDLIVSMIQHEAGNIEKVKQIEKDYRHWTNCVTEQGFSEDFEFDSETLISWKTLYSEYAELPTGRLPNPFSKRSKIKKELRILEEKIIPALPLPLKQSIGINTVQQEKNITDQSRDALSTQINNLLLWFEAKYHQQLTIPEEERVFSVFSDISRDFSSLKLFYPPASMLDVNGWRHTAEQLTDKIAIAEDAHSAFIAHNSLQDFKKILAEFSPIAASSPVKNAWISNAGKSLTDSIKTLITKLDVQSLQEARDSVMTNDLELFVSEWKQLIGLIKKYADLYEEMEQIPTENDISQKWWEKNPTNNVLYPDQTMIPEDVSVFDKHLTECREVQELWHKHAQNTIPEQEKIIQENLSWARSEIKSACRKIPDENARLEIERQILPIISKNNDQWPLEVIRSRFEQFRSSEINMQIAAIDQKLQSQSFKIASYKRVEYLRQMDGFSKEREDSQNAHNHSSTNESGKSPVLPPIKNRLTKLLDHYGKSKFNSYTLPRELNDLFIRCLPAIPIWVTTSLSTQSIPVKPSIFDLVVIDEACQCDISSVLPMIYRAKRLAVIGDPHQLEAINMISSPELDRKIANNHAIEEIPDTFRHINNNLYKLAERSLPDNGFVVDLLEHYRSHPQIVGFINMYVYNKRLIIKKEIDCTEQDLAEEGIFGRDVKGACIRVSNSWKNEREADEVVRVARELIDEKGYTGSQIGVVTPFSPQQKLIEGKINSKLSNPGITVGTANTFQGNERDIMIFSPVLSRGIWDASVNFVQNPVNRVNVALSRARNALYVVADFDFCKKTPGIISELIHYIETINSLRLSAKQQGYEQLYLYTLMLIEGWKPAINRKIRGITVDLTLQEAGARIAIFITSKSASESEKTSRLEAVKSKGFELMEIPARKISETPKEVISTIHDKIEYGYRSD